MRPTKTTGILTSLLVALAVITVACDGGQDERPAATPTAAADENLGLPAMAAAPPLTPEDGTPGGVGLEWWGQSMFRLLSPRGADIAIDPFGDIGYRVPEPREVGVGIVTVSHEHPDHNNVAITGASVILRGLTEDGWLQIDERPTSDVRIRSVPSWHDDSRGADRGRNAIFIFETGGLRIVHLGDLGHQLTAAQIAAIGPVDVLLVPVGGFFTIDAAGATAVMEELRPRLTIPMHYKTEDVAIAQLQPVDAFLEGKQVERMSWGVEVDADGLPPYGSSVVWVLEPKMARD